jgi:hypothetical protein
MQLDFEERNKADGHGNDVIEPGEKVVLAIT